MEHWQKVMAMAHMQDYIEAHISEPITRAELSRKAGYSQWHTARIFKELTRHTPFDYVRMMRLTKAAERLVDGGTKVVDVAFDFVFGSHEGFTRTFTRQFGLPPKRFVQQCTPFQSFLPTQAHDYYLTLLRGENTMANLNTVFVQVVERPERKLILKRGKKVTNYFDYCRRGGLRGVGRADGYPRGAV